ncbi:BCLAF1 and THRAP3 family member 3 isoform 2-T2 [Mantella aurantiaca]
MAKSRSRSPRWKSRPPPQRSPERNRHRHFQDYYHENDDFHRDSRRSTHWEDAHNKQNNSRFEPYSHFSDNLVEQGSFDPNPRRSPFEAINRPKRSYSLERRGESNRRFPPKSPEDTNYRENTRNFHNHRNHDRNGENINVHNNGFKAARREDNFHRPYNRDHNKNWHESDGHWNQHDPANQYLSPHRRRLEEHERKSFQKRYPEDDYREHEPSHKRTREAERHDFRPPLKSSHWKDDHPERPYYAKDWSKDVGYKDPSPFVHEKHSGALTKIEHDYSHGSPTYAYTEPILEDEYTKRHNHADRHNRHEERKTESTKTSQYHKTPDGNSRERRRYDDRSLEPLHQYSSKKHDDNTISKNDIDMKHASHKHKEKTRKEGDYQRRKEDEYQKNPISPLHLRSQSPQTADPKDVLMVTSEKESIVVNLALKKSSDKYRQPREQRSKPKHLSPPSNTNQEQEISEEKPILVGDMQKSNSSSKDRQLSHDLVAVAGKETFHPVFDHLESSLLGDTKAPNSEFTQKIITIIHEVKANHFRSAGMSLHERFTKMQSESNKQELNLNNPTPQTNPEIHRRIDISLEELQSKTFHKTVEVSPGSHRVIEDPNDLRHDIERRRKQRLHSGQNGTADSSYNDSDASSSCYALPHQEMGEFHSSSRVSRPPFRKSTGRPPVRGTYYRGKFNQYYTSRDSFEDTDELRKPYKGWGNPAARI